MLDIKLIEEFRGVTHERWFALFIYSNKHNKNQWACICSAMDWITVAIEHLKKYPENKVRDMGSMEMFSYIASVDVIVEAVQQLHRVIFSTDKQLFGKDKDCFRGNKFNQTDLEYFKTIRSCFGAHPVNLEEPGEEGNKEKRRFASWSGGHFGEKDFTVILYSNQVGEKDIHLSIDMKQVFAFAQKHYDYLNVLMDELRKQYEEFQAEQKGRHFLCEGDALTRLYILKDESVKRLNNDYYRMTIDELILIFETPITCEKNKELVEEYRDALENLIDEIYHNLQEMKFVDLEYGWLLDADRAEGLPDGWGYWYEKLSSYVFGSGYETEFWRGRIESIFGKYFELSYQSYTELYVLVNAAIYHLSIAGD